MQGLTAVRVGFAVIRVFVLTLLTPILIIYLFPEKGRPTDRTAAKKAPDHISYSPGESC